MVKRQECPVVHCQGAETPALLVSYLALHGMFLLVTDRGLRKLPEENGKRALKGMKLTPCRS